MTPRTGTRRTRARFGATLLETLLALGLLAVIVTGFTILLGDYSEEQKARIVATRLQAVGDAAQRYMERNAVKLLAASPGGAPVRIPVAKTRAGDAVPPGPTMDLPSLQGGGFLPSVFVDANSYGQSHVLIVRRVVGTDRIEGMVSTKDGRPIPDGVLGRIASAVGQTAGFVPTSTVSGVSGRITGTAGGWAADAAAWQVAGVGPKAGHAVTTIALAQGALVSDYVHRKFIGDAEANRMRTNFSLGRNAVVDVPRIENGKAVVTLEPDRIGISTDTDVTRDLSAEAIVAEGVANSPVFTDMQDPSYKVDPNARSRFFDLASESIDTDTKAYGDSMKIATPGSTTKDLGSYLRHDMIVVKKTGSFGGGQEMAEVYCPATHIRIGCAGGRSDPLLDTCQEGQCGFVGAIPVDSGTRQGCQTVIDGQEGTQPVVQAFCLSNVESAGAGAAEPVPMPPVVAEPGTQCPVWAPGTWPNCKLPPECPAWAPGVYPKCMLPSPGPQCPAWAPGVYPKCVVGICPPWLPGDFPYCGTQPVFDLYSVTCTSNLGRTQTIVGEGTDGVVTARAPSNGSTWVMKLGGPYRNCNDTYYGATGPDTMLNDPLCVKFTPNASPFESTPLVGCSWRRLN